MTVYCIIPQDLAAKLHPLLRDLYRHDERVEVVVERRILERRGSERRTGATAIGGDVERRTIRSDRGRRLAERRATALPIAKPSLPRKAQPFADRLAFVERAEPSDQRAEDLEADRLIVSFQAGDQGMFNELYLRYFNRIYSYVVIALRDPHEAEDVTQGIFERVFGALGRYQIRPDKTFRSWLFTIARNQVINHLEKHRRVQPMEPEALERHRHRQAEVAVEDWSLDWLSDSELLMFIERLPLNQRQVLMLRFMAGMSTSEIAVVLGHKPESIRQIQHRALTFLSDRLAAIGRKPIATTRHASEPLLRQVRVLRARRFALS